MVSHLEEFNSLKEGLIETTRGISSSTFIVENEYSKKIIAKGYLFLPFILKSLKKKEFRWFSHLILIFRKDIVPLEYRGCTEKQILYWVNYMEKLEGLVDNIFRVLEAHCNTDFIEDKDAVRCDLRELLSTNLLPLCQVPKNLNSEEYKEWMDRVAEELKRPSIRIVDSN